MPLPALPAEIWSEIATHVAQQSGLDLLAFSRVSANCRQAARRAGRADLIKYAIEVGATNDLPPSERLRVSPLLQSCIQPLPTLSFPGKKFGAWGEFFLGPLAYNFQQCGGASDGQESGWAFTSSLIIRDAGPESVQMWDALEYPVKLLEIHFAHPIPRYIDEGKDCKHAEEDDLLPCVTLQAITLGDMRIVLAQTPAERTFHVLDAFGGPFLSYTLDPLPTVLQKLLLVDEPFPCEGGADCRGWCKGPRWVGLGWAWHWYAARLLRRRPSDRDHGLVFSFLQPKSTRLDWMVLLNPIDTQSSVIVRSGQLDLASLGLSDGRNTDLLTETFRLEALCLADDPAGWVLQLHWMQQEDHDPNKVYTSNIVHITLSALLHSASRQGNLPRVATARFETPLEKIDSTSEHFRLSRDALQLFSLLPSLEDRDSAVLRVHQRATINNPWDAAPNFQALTNRDARVLRASHDWLILTPGKQWLNRPTKCSVQVLSITSPSLAGLQTLCLLPATPREEVLAASGWESAEKRCFVLTLVADVVLGTDDNGVIFGNSLVFEAGIAPRLVDLSNLIGLISQLKPFSPASYRIGGVFSQLTAINNIHNAGVDYILRLRFPDDPTLYFDHLYLNYLEPRGFSAQEEKPLIMVAIARSDTNTFDSPLDPDAQYALLVQPRSHDLHAILCRSAETGRASFDLESDDLHPVQGHLFFDVLENYENKVVVLDADAGAALIVPVQQSAVVSGRWSHDCAPSLLFPSGELKEGQRRWYAVKSDKAPTDTAQTEAEGRFHRLGDLVWKKVENEWIYAYGMAEQEYRTVRFLPNWLLPNGGRGVYIGGVKRLLSFLTE